MNRSKNQKSGQGTVGPKSTYGKEQTTDPNARPAKSGKSSKKR